MAGNSKLLLKTFFEKRAKITFQIYIQWFDILEIFRYAIFSLEYHDTLLLTKEIVKLCDFKDYVKKIKDFKFSGMSLVRNLFSVFISARKNSKI